MIHKIKDLFKNARKAFRYYPVTLIIAFLLFCSLVILTESKEAVDFRKAMTYFALFLAIAFWWSAFAETLKTKFKYFLLGGLTAITAAGVYFFYEFDMNYEFSIPESDVFRLVIWLSLAQFSFLLAFAYNKDNEKFIRKVLILISDFLLAYLFALVLHSGLALAVGAIDFLFIPDTGRWEEFFWNLQLYIVYFSYLLILPVLFFSRISQEKDVNIRSKVFKIFVTSIFIPFSWLYLVILYLYAFKILITWHLPSNGVAIYVILFSMYALLTYVLSYPFKQETSNKLVQYIPKPYFFLLLPMLFLLFVSIWQRIYAYGWTPFRYYVVLGGSYVLPVSLLILFKKNFRMHWLLAILIGMFFLGTYFPYLNAFAVSYRSQNNQVKKWFEKNKENLEKKSLPSKEARILKDKIRFLKNWYRKMEMENIPEEYRKKIEMKDGYIVNAYPLTDDIQEMAVEKIEIPKYYRYFDCSPKTFSKPVQRDLGKYVILSEEEENTLEIAGDKYQFYFSEEEIRIIKNGKDVSYKWRDFLHKLSSAPEDSCPSFSVGNYEIFIQRINLSRKDKSFDSATIEIYENAPEK